MAMLVRKVMGSAGVPAGGQHDPVHFCLIAHQAHIEWITGNALHRFRVHRL